MPTEIFNETKLSPEGRDFLGKATKHITDQVGKIMDDLVAGNNPHVEKCFIVQSIGYDLIQMAAQIFYYQGNSASDPNAAIACRAILQAKMGELFDLVVAANTPDNTTKN